MFCVEGNAFNTFVRPQYTQCVWVTNTKFKHNFCLFTRKLQRTPLKKNCLNTAHLGGPAHVILLAWLLLFTVSLHWWLHCSVPGSALEADRSCSTGVAEGVGGFPLPDTTSLCSVVCQHFGQILAAAQLVYDAGAGKIVGGQDVDGLRLRAAVDLSTNQGGGGRVFKEQPLSAPVQFLEVLVEERR